MVDPAADVFEAGVNAGRFVDQLDDQRSAVFAGRFAQVLTALFRDHTVVREGRRDLAQNDCLRAIVGDGDRRLIAFVHRLGGVGVHRAANNRCLATGCLGNFKDVLDVRHGESRQGL